MHPRGEDYQYGEDFSHIQHCCVLVPAYSSQPYTFGEQETEACLHQLQVSKKEAVSAKVAKKSICNISFKNDNNIELHETGST